MLHLHGICTATRKWSAMLVSLSVLVLLTVGHAPAPAAQPDSPGAKELAAGRES